MSVIKKRVITSIKLVTRNCTWQIHKIFGFQYVHGLAQIHYGRGTGVS